jgi:hypothetical protein
MRLDGEQQKRAGRSLERHFRLTSPSLLRVLLGPPAGGAMRIDFELSGHGTLYLLRPVSRAAHNWVEEHLPADATWFGGAVVVGPIIGGAIGDGLLVQ